jgi:hypothetical protein
VPRARWVATGQIQVSPLSPQSDLRCDWVEKMFARATRERGVTMPEHHAVVDAEICSCSQSQLLRSVAQPRGFPPTSRLPRHCVDFDFLRTLAWSVGRLRISVTGRNPFVTRVSSRLGFRHNWWLMVAFCLQREERRPGNPAPPRLHLALGSSRKT